MEVVEKVATPLCDALASASNGRDIQQGDYYNALDLARKLERDRWELMGLVGKLLDAQRTYDVQPTVEMAEALDAARAFLHRPE